MSKQKTSYITILVVVVMILGGWYCKGYGHDAPKHSPVRVLVKHTLAHMVYFPPATYTMGAVTKKLINANPATYPSHKVHLSGFYMYKFNVSYGEYDIYSEITGKAKLDKAELGFYSRRSNHPVDVANWYEANAYCQWLAKITGLPFSLPTEAQWQYVARDGGKKDWIWPTNDGKKELGKNYPSFNQKTTHKGNISAGTFALPVGSIPCTPKGICGLGGEVNEWVNDWYGRDYYAHSPVDNPQGPKTGKLKTMTASSGGSGFGYSFMRTGDDPKDKNGGFRCVINSEKSLSEIKAIAAQHLSKLKKQKGK